MTPEEFDSIYGDALAGVEQKTETIKPKVSQPGSSNGTSAASQAKTARDKQITQPTASQADTFDDDAIQSTAIPTYEPPMPPPPRVPLYKQAGGVSGLAQMTPPAVAQRAIESGFTNIYNPAIQAVNRAGSAVGNELAFQAAPILGDAELARQKLLAKLRGGQ